MTTDLKNASEMRNVLRHHGDAEAARLAAKWGWPDGALVKVHAEVQAQIEHERAERAVRLAEQAAEDARWEADRVAGRVKEYAVRITETKIRSGVVTVEARSLEEAECLAVDREHEALGHYGRDDYECELTYAVEQEPSAVARSETDRS